MRKIFLTLLALAFLASSAFAQGYDVIKVGTFTLKGQSDAYGGRLDTAAVLFSFKDVDFGSQMSFAHVVNDTLGTAGAVVTIVPLRDSLFTLIMQQDTTHTLAVGGLRTVKFTFAPATSASYFGEYSDTFDITGTKVFPVVYTETDSVDTLNSCNEKLFMFQFALPPAYEYVMMASLTVFDTDGAVHADVHVIKYILYGPKK